jgi:hypothetical protein
MFSTKIIDLCLMKDLNVPNSLTVVFLSVFRSSPTGTNESNGFGKYDLSHL